MRCENPQGYALPDAPYTVVPSLSAAWRALHRAENSRGPGKDSRGAAAALGGLAGGEGQGFQRKLMPIAAPSGKAHGNYRHGWR